MKGRRGILAAVVFLGLLTSYPAGAQVVQGFDDSRSLTGWISGQSFSFVTGPGFSLARSLIQSNFAGATFLSGVPEVTYASLQGVDIFVINPLNQALSAAEVNALTSFVNNGGALLEIRDLGSRAPLLGTVPGPARGELHPQSVNGASPLIAGPFGPPITVDLRMGFNYAFAQLGDAVEAASNTAGPNIIQLSAGPGRRGAAVLIGDEEIFMNDGVVGERAGELSNSTVNETLFLNTFAFLDAAPGLDTFAAGTVVTYAPSAEIFANPERGFFHAEETHSTAYVPLDQNALLDYRQNEEIALIKRYFYLDDFVGSPISQTYLDKVQADFDALRAAGLKAVVRFAYVNQTLTPPYGDADKAQVLAHLTQLQPILRANGDVIALVEAGFIGNWGEWFYTDHFVADPSNPGDIQPADFANRREVLEKVLDVLPEHMVQLRTPFYKYEIYGTVVGSPPLPVPLTSSTAHQGSDIARTGHHNDCFLGNANDGGTFGWIGIAVDKSYLAAETEYVPMGGEVCDPLVIPPTTRFDCASTLAELEQFHWSYLNVQTGALGDEVYDDWAANGCLPEIERRLGYRLALVEGTYTDAVESNGAFTVHIELQNDGWAALYNARPVELVLRNKATAAVISKPLAGEDPRFWLAGQTHVLHRTLQADMAPGDYELLLHLPDAQPSLAARSEYAIRLANVGVWEATTGYNDLGHTLQVTQASLGIAAPDTTGTYDETLRLPLQVGDTSGWQIVAAETFVAYDGDLLTAQSVVTSNSLLSPDWSLETNMVEGVGTSMDTIKVAMATDDDALVGEGSLFFIDFQVADVRHPASSPLELTHALFNQGDPVAAAVDGSVKLVGVDGTIGSDPAEIIPRWDIVVTVQDADENRDGLQPDSFEVGMTNGAQTEQLTLVETGVSTGIFTGSIGTVFSLSFSSDDGIVQASAGDALHLCYVDSLDGAGNTLQRCATTQVVGGSDGALRTTVASQPGDTVRVRVIDADLEGSVVVTAANGRTGEVESILLSSFGASDSLFFGRFFTSLQAGSSGDSTLQVAKGDVLAISYADTLTEQGGTAALSDDNEVVDPFGNADGNGQVQAFDAARVLLHSLTPFLSGLDSLAANLDLQAFDPVAGKITPFDASLILQKRVGLIDRFPLQEDEADNHPQPETDLSTPKRIAETWQLQLAYRNGVVHVEADERTAIVSGDLVIAGAVGPVVMAEELSGFLQSSLETEEGLHLVFAGTEGASGQGELLRIGVGQGAQNVRLLRARFNDGRIVGRSDGTTAVGGLPQLSRLYANAPNPFNPETLIRFDLAAQVPVRLEIFDALGQRVRLLVDAVRAAGTYGVEWDGRDAAGRQVGSGVYLYRLQAGDFLRTRRMVLVR